MLLALANIGAARRLARHVRCLHVDFITWRAATMQEVTPLLWFDGKAEEAAGAQRAPMAMLQTRKLDISILERAHRNA